MAPTDVVRTAFYGIVAVSGAWLVGLLACTSTWVQRQIFYLHNLPIDWGQRLDEPETFGFLKNQVTPFKVKSKDGTQLYAWLVTPLKLYANHESAVVNDESSYGDIENKEAFKLLTSNENSRLVIYFHGNAGSVGQTRRTEAYRSIYSGAPESIHVLAFDYRGFGRSEGTPSESGLIEDAIAVIRWAMEVAKISPSRITLLAQSLGTGVACGAAHHFINSEPKVEFASLVLCAAFIDASTIFLDYRLLGYVPCLALIKLIPSMRGWICHHIKDTWRTADRLSDLLIKSSTHLTLCHATWDTTVPHEHSRHLFYRAVNAIEDDILTNSEIDQKAISVSLGEGGVSYTWTQHSKRIELLLVKHGGHNGIMKWAPVALIILKSFPDLT